MFQGKYSISLLLRILPVMAVFVLGACNLKPLHAKKESLSGGSCSNFKVDPINFDQVGQKLRYKLQDSLNASCSNNKKYVISVELAKEKESIGLQKDREITRYNVFLVAVYRVREQGGNEVILEGRRKLAGGFDAVVSDYGTYAQEQDTYRKLADELARDLSLKISGFLNSSEE